MTRKLGAGCVLFILLGATGLARGQAQGERGAQQFAEFGDFKLKSGAVIHDFRLGYRTLGTLNAEKS
ncbi:MAG: hypothetical protein WBW54_04125, partial [Candidatus Acidiferrales bacterium]